MGAVAGIYSMYCIESGLKADSTERSVPARGNGLPEGKRLDGDDRTAIEGSCLTLAVRRSRTFCADAYPCRRSRSAVAAS